MKLPKKRLLICIDWFNPAYKAGGPIQSVFNMVQALKKDYDIWILTGDRDLGDSVPFSDIVLDEWVERDGYHIMYASRSTLSYQRIKGLLKQHTPHHIYVNGMFSKYFTVYPLLVNWCNKFLRGARITVAPRGMLLESAISKKAGKKKPFLRLSRPLFTQPNIRFQATNEPEQRSVNEWYKGSECFVVNNLGKQDQEPNQPLRKVPGQINLVFVARIDPIKNLDLLLDLLPGVSGEVGLKIIGPIDDREYWEACRLKISELPPHIRVSYEGPRHPAELNAYLREAHLYVLLTKGENFGHTIFESWLAGRPVLISDQTPWKGLRPVKLGFDMDLSDHAGIIEALNQAISWSQAEFDEFSRESWNFAARYLLEDRNKAMYYQIFS